MNGVSRLSYTEDIVLLTLRCDTHANILIGDIFTEFAKEGIVIDMISQSAPQGSLMDISFTTFSSDMIKVFAVISRIRDDYKTIKLMVSTGNCKIQLFGEEMPQLNGVAARAIMALVSNGIDIITITTSEVDISLVVSAADSACAVEMLEKAFEIRASRV